MIGHAQPAAPVGRDAIGRPLQAVLRAVALQGCKPALVDELIESGRAAGARLRIGPQPAFDPGLLVEIAEIHAGAAARLRVRSEERRVGKGCVSKFRSRWWRYH